MGKIPDLIKAFYLKYSKIYDIQITSYTWQEYDIPLDDDFEEQLVQKLERNRIQRDKAIMFNWTIPHEFQPDCKYNIGSTLFETDRIPQRWVSYCNKMQEIWLPSTFNKQTFLNSGVIPPIRVIPGGVDSFYFESDSPLDIPNYTTTFNFFTAGQWTPANQDRKNIPKVLRTFLKTFKDRDDVGLVMKVYTINGNTMDFNYVKKRIREIRESVGIMNYPKVYLVHGSLEMVGIYGFFE